MIFVPGGFSFDPFAAEFHRRLAAKGASLVFLVHDVLPVTQSRLVPGGGSVFVSSFSLPAEIVTTTQFNAADFRRAYQALMRRPYRPAIKVVPLAHEFPGAPRNAPPGVPSPRLAERLQGRPFALSVGTVDIRKNHIRLLNAWCALQAELGDLPLLVVAGRRGREAEAALTILDRAEDYGDPIVFIESPSDDELKWLYASCTFSILPSLVEGWGLPVGESLWFGKACAASKTSSIPEAGGDLCVYFDPRDESEMKIAIRQLLDSSVRHGFEDRIKAADLRTWADVARDLLAALLKLADEPRA
jgi:glycosyltransferase involved in cell wall biosynthesis